jgi:hypothetical protein
LVGLLLAAINLLHEVPRKYTVSIELGGLSREQNRVGLSGMALHILDEVLLILGGSIDWGALSGLGLLATAHGSPGTGEDAAEGGHGKLVKKRDPVSSHVSQVSARRERDGGCAAVLAGSSVRLTTWEPTFLPAIW